MSQITKLFDYDPLTRTKKLFHYDADTDTFTIENQQDVTDLVGDNKTAYNLFDERANWKGDLHKVASIPLTVMYDLKRKGMWFDQDPAAFRRWLNDPDNRFFRTRPGRI